MTSMAADSVATILVSCKQTRFHIESPNYRELDIQGLDITVASGPPSSKAAGARGKARGKARAARASDGTEVLSNAKLRLKAGRRYALVGRNGSGKSTLLRAIAEKLIPGIPEQTRIAVLQQTDDGGDDDDDDDDDDDGVAASPRPGRSRTVLEEVVERATSRDELEREIAVLAGGVDGPDAADAVRALRRVRHERVQKRLFLLDKAARLRSGARGFAARRELIAFEKEVAGSAALQDQDEQDISPAAADAEVQEATDMLADLQLQLDPSRLADVESRARKILAGLGFSEAYMSEPVSGLSGGWRMRTALAAVLLQEADILILDEPTNFLDLLGIIWLQRHLQALQDSPDAPTLILVSHDRAFLSLCTDLLLLKDKDLTYFVGDLAMYESSTSERRQYLTKMKEAKDRQKAHIQATIARSMKEGKKKDDENRIRQAKQRQKKLDDRWGMEVGIKGGRFKINRDLPGYHLTSRADIEVPREDRPLTIVLPEPPDLRFPGPLISMEGVTFRYPREGGDNSKRTPDVTSSPAAVLRDVTLSVGMGDRVGILGLNGAGKSTLVKLLVGEETPTPTPTPTPTSAGGGGGGGVLATHPRLRLGYYGQGAVEGLRRLGRAEPELTALALLARDAGAAGPGPDDEGALRGLLGSLGLHGREASAVPVRRLSGGQLVRCGLARVLRQRPHCLVLDEVTTHLDYETVAALRAALRRWEGAVVLVSHDRWFVRGVVEGLVDDDDDDDVGSDAGEEEAGGDDGEDEGEALRRRVVYRIKGGALVRLENGVQEFEDLMERRVRKLSSP